MALSRQLSLPGVTGLLLVWLALTTAPVAQQAIPAACVGGVASAAAVARTVEVASLDALESALRNARPGDRIVVAPGRYRLRSTLNIDTAGVTLAGGGSDPAKVILEGRGMTDDGIAVGVSVNVANVTVTGLTVQNVRYHAVQVRGERKADGFRLISARLLDAGEQLLKVSAAQGGGFADNGLVACSEFAYSDHAPSDYTNAIDMLATKGWVIRDNRIARIRGPVSGGWEAGPAILVWAGAEDTLVERNVVVDSYRGIALGIYPGNAYARNGVTSYDHRDGIIRNNLVVNLNRWADEGIEATASPGVRIEHNTVFVEGTLGWSISVRFASTDAIVRNNLTNRLVLSRDGARMLSEGNVMGAERHWFVGLPSDAHLTAAAKSAIDAGVATAGIETDFEHRPRIGAPDAGAFEASGALHTR